MIFALIFLSVSLVLSQQQRHPAPTSGDMMYWLSHYYLPLRQAFNHYNNNYHHPVNCEAHPGYYHPFLRHFTLAKPNSQTFSQQVKMETQEPYANYDAVESANGLDDENEFSDYQPRIKGFNRIRPLFQPKKKPQNDPRFVINLASPYNLFNKKVKTITFTLTSSLTFTSVKSCIPSEQFFNGSADVSCRRKRREIVEVDQGIESDEMTQFAIISSDVQPLEPTRLSSSLDLRMKDDYGQRTDARTFNRQQIISSKDEDELTSPTKYSRGKRLFFHFVTTTTVISYSFLSTTVTKTVNLLNTIFNPGAYLICRPDGYAVCPYTANNNNNNNNNNNDPCCASQ